MKVKTTKAAKLSDDNAYSSNVSEPVSGGTTAHTLKSCCATMIASRTKTNPPSSQGTFRRRGRISLDSLKLSVGLLTENGLITGQASAKSSTDKVRTSHPGPLPSGVQSTDFSRVFVSREKTQLKLVLYAPSNQGHPHPILSQREREPQDARMLRSMDAQKFFFDDKRHLRSAWRLCLFVVVFFTCAAFVQVLLISLIGLVLHRPVTELAGSGWHFAADHGSLLISAALVGWGCGRLFEGLPFRALGCSLSPGWLKDLGIGSALGAASLMLAAVLATVTRGVDFSLDRVSAGAIGKTLAISALVFVFAAAAEEMLFRGYPLQTLTRANLAWLGVFLTSVPFAAAHLYHPNIVPRLTFLNTALAGVLLAVGYLGSGSLWFPIGRHWAGNSMQRAGGGVPVSGINQITPAPLLHAMDNRPGLLKGRGYRILAR